MPLSTSPNRGYADYQRLSNFDSGVLARLQPTNITANFFSGLLDVSRYEYIAGRATCSLAFYQLSFAWYSDASQTVNVGNRTMMLSLDVANVMQFRLPNLGPYVNVSTVGPAPAGTPAYTGDVMLFGSNRSHPLEIIPVAPQILVATNNAVAAGATWIVYGMEYYAGPATFLLAANTTAFYCNALTMQRGGGYVNIDQISGAANSVARGTMVIPPGAWGLQIGNQGGVVGSASIWVTPSTTGAT